MQTVSTFAGAGTMNSSHVERVTCAAVRFGGAEWMIQLPFTPSLQTCSQAKGYKMGPTSRVVPESCVCNFLPPCRTGLFHLSPPPSIFPVLYSRHLYLPLNALSCRLGRYRVLSPLAGIRVSPLQLGAMSIGDRWGALGAMDKESSFKLLDAYFDAGGNLIDTSRN